MKLLFVFLTIAYDSQTAADPAEDVQAEHANSPATLVTKLLFCGCCGKT